MNNHSIIQILKEGALLLDHDFDPAALRFVGINNREYNEDQFDEFKRDLLEAGSKIRILFLEQRVPTSVWNDFIEKEKSVVLTFFKKGERLTPVLFYHQKKSLIRRPLESENEINQDFQLEDNDSYLRDDDGDIITLSLAPYKSIVSDYTYDGDATAVPLSPVRRFFRMLATEKKEIFYILFYSVIIGLTGLILPLGIQNTVELISGGVFTSSIYILITAVILGILLTGVLQIMQISMVEYLQRRIFTKAALEFAFRIPRIKMESIINNYAPELVNRFFDVITVQKGLPKLLIDIMSGVFQILFGLILLSLYHPFFVGFGLVLILLLVGIFWMTGPGGLKSSINESKYKYKVAQWLEELARAINSFKIAGETDLPLKRTDETVNNYLKHRKLHFNVLITQYTVILVFKTAVTASLLIIGAILVVDREITLGQFVASEVIIILMLNAVEKVIAYIDIVYDLFTAVDKISQVTDLPLEKVGGLYFPREINGAYSVDVKNLSYQYPDQNGKALNNISLSISPGERVCIAGPGNAGKTTLTNLIAGLHGGFEGQITINNYSIRDLDVRRLRDKIAKSISPEDIFDGTVLENITLGNSTRKVEDALNAIKRVKLENQINSFPSGIMTHVVSGGKGFSSSFIHKLILARCLTKKPSLIILNDFFSGLKRDEKSELLECVVHKDEISRQWTLITVSNDPLVMSACDRILILENGSITDSGDYQTLLKKGSIKNYIE